MVCVFPKVLYGIQCTHNTVLVKAVAPVRPAIPGAMPAVEFLLAPLCCDACGGEHGVLVLDAAGMADGGSYTFGDVEIRLQALHSTVDGRRFLVIHGERFAEAMAARD